MATMPHSGRGPSLCCTSFSTRDSPKLRRKFDAGAKARVCCDRGRGNEALGEADPGDPRAAGSFLRRLHNDMRRKAQSRQVSTCSSQYYLQQRLHSRARLSYPPSMANTNAKADPSSTYHFDNLLNFRDVGAHINTIVGRHVLKPGLLFRSARPDEASKSDCDVLVNKYKIKTIVDLRSKTEHINAAKKRSDVGPGVESAALPASEQAFDKTVRDPVEIPGVRYAYINLNGKGFERHLIWQLKYTSLAKLVFLMAAGYRTQGISVLGKELMLPRGLVGLGLDTLDYSGPEIKEVFGVFADSSAWPIMVNCTQGKDRTGITVLLVLLLCHVDLNAITQDYVRSEPELEREKAERMKEIESIGLDESFATCPPDFCPKVVKHLDTKYGGINAYLAKIGVDANQAEKIRNVLAVNP